MSDRKIVDALTTITSNQEARRKSTIDRHEKQCKQREAIAFLWGVIGGLLLGMAVALMAWMYSDSHR